jgi:hypothetical protein
MAGIHSPLVLHEDCSSEDVARLVQFLEGKGTFHFPTLPNGLFSAAAGEGGDFDLTGYSNVWVRDNVHIAHAHWRWGEVDKAVAATRSLMAYFLKYKHRFTDMIEGRVNPSDPMNRPHIRFDGVHLEELNEKWSHAQNDALGAFLWLACNLNDECQWNATDLELLSFVAAFLNAIHFWNDEDSGHWEEVRKVAASSIGVATAGLEAWQALALSKEKVPRSSSVRTSAPKHLEGRRALETILPSECIQVDPQKNRRYDSALLFLIYPYGVVTAEMADQIVADVTTHLQGEHGIRRYLGDSYWCADYKQKLAADVRTADFSDNIEDRNRLLEPGSEAQWCLFDPIVSIHYGLKYERSRNPEDRRAQIAYLNRSLGQLTTAESRFGPYRCPESYYRERGHYVPNDICPLLWTQANLKLALQRLGRQSN